MFSYAFPDLLLTRIRTGVTICLDVDHIWQRAGVLCNVLDVYRAGDVEAAVTYEHADSGLFRFGG
jgi:hypothetical protein